MKPLSAATLARFALRHAKPVFDLLFRERRCSACGRPFLPGPSASGSEASFCPSCAPAVARRTTGFCPLCGRLAPWPDMPVALCGPCFIAPPPWDAFLFHGSYEGVLRALLLRLKFGNDLAPAKALATLSASLFARPELEGHCFLPVPLHPRRLKERGYNQTLELGRGLSAATGLPLLSNGLTRTRPTIPQTSLSLSGRKNNLAGAFKGTPDMVAGKRLILLDDVASSGATMRAAAEALLRAGAASVTAAAIARA